MAATTRTDKRIEDALWLLDAGENPAHVYHRVGWPTLAAMERALQRNGLPELARKARRAAA